MNRVQGLLKTCPIDSSATTQIMIYGRVKGKRYPAWKVTIALVDRARSAQDSAEQTTGFSRWIVRPFRSSLRPPLRPAERGFKDVSPPAQNLGLSSDPAPELLAIASDLKADLGALGSQQWIAASLLGMFLVAIGVYLYIGTWFIPHQAQQWSKLQPELDRIEAAKPRNLEEMAILLQEMEDSIGQLRGFSPLSGTFYQRARAHIQILNDRHRELQHRQDIEQAGQTYLGQAKRLAAQATLLLENHTSPSSPLSPSDRRSIEQNWLVALYWLNQVPGQSFAIRERNQLLRLYQKNYWQMQQDAEQSIPFTGTLL